ncbi:MAG TPA: S9 family peptidase [Ignavibacteria bacterium]|nr:S9 family peptidase [Ignavibacteria bacterium]
MKNLKLFLLFIMVYSMQLFAQLPPLIDREIFFGDPEISGAQISPDGKFITFVKPYNNIRNIWVKEFDEPFENARPLTADSSRPIRAYFWSVDSKFVLYVQDKGGDENFRVYAVNPTESGDPVPNARDLTPYDDVRATIYSVPKKTPGQIIIGLNDRDPQVHDVYRLNLNDGTRELLWQNDQNVVSWSIDLDGNLRLGIRMLPDGGSEILKIEENDLVSIYSVNNEETASPIRFMPDGNSFYMITNKGDDLDKTQLVLYNLEDNSIEFIEKDPLDEVDFGGAYFSDITNELIFTTYVGDKRRLYFKNDEFEKDYEKLKTLLPDGEISLRSMTEDENIWLVSVSRDVDPGSVYVFNRKEGKAEFLYQSNPKLPVDHLAPMKPIRYEARDGLIIPAYLTLPKGIPSENLPTILLIHGGPWARDYWGYDPIAQFLANRGYAVLQPNFRGSTGYGKAFLNAGNKEWGRGAMQHDITDAVKWLIEEGIADPERVGIAGGSYGGYATLAGLAFTPELYAAGFDIVGPSNIITLLNSIPPYWAPIKKIFDVRVGDMNDPEELKMLQEQSPLNYAENIIRPLFVVQGANDPRVKQAESDQIVVALRDLGREIEYMVAEDEGHGFAGLENRLAMTVAMEEFFAKHLKGRYQEDVRDEIKERLDKLMVDINTVTLPVKESTSAEKVFEFDGSKIQEQESKYLMTIEARGQTMNMDVFRKIAKSIYNDKEVFIVIDEVTGMMGGLDTLYLDSKTLQPIKRLAKQGMAKVNVQFGSEKIEGLISAGPQQMPINVSIDSPVLSEGTNTELAICSLPLNDNYAATLDLFDMMGGKVKTLSVKVVGSEHIEINGNTFDTYKVELDPVDDDNGSSILWISKELNKVVKSESKLPPMMGGGTVITELMN